jgi:hypothetical protein
MKSSGSGHTKEEIMFGDFLAAKITIHDNFLSLVNQPVVCSDKEK